jgi:GTP-binding protein YchF
MVSVARLGIVGFTNSGKTTLFNALTGLEAVTAPHPYSTTEPNLGVAKIPDPLLQHAARLEGSAKVVPATLDLLDLPALTRASEGGGALARLREMDALIVVIRTFDDESVPFEASTSDPLGQVEELLLEMAVADHDLLAKRADRLAREANSEPAKRPAAAEIGETAAHLATGQALRARPWPPATLEALRDSAPLTLKPAVWVINHGESGGPSQEVLAEVQKAVPPGDVVVAVSARIEEEASRLSDEDRSELAEGLGLGEGVLARMVRAAYQSLGLISFYTVGPKESRAWTVRAGAMAPEAAGKIHSDLERGFIRAEVAQMDEVIAAGGWDEAKRQGRIRVEGKSYVVQPADVMVVRFSV